MELKRTIRATIPVMSYGNIGMEISGEVGSGRDFYNAIMPEIEEMFNKYAEDELVIKQEGVFEEIETFTGETVLYDIVNHKYKTLDGKKLISGSTYAHKFEKPFPKEMMLGKLAKKYGVAEHIIDDMWSRNSSISTSFGSAIHMVMEQYWKHNEHGCEDKEYHLPKHPILRAAIENFPEKEFEEGFKVIPELMVSSVSQRMVGQIDGLLGSVDKKEAELWDYKTDADMDKNKLKIHFIQLSFYAHILKSFGWKINKIVVWNYTGEWTKHESEPFDLKELENSLKK